MSPVLEAYVKIGNQLKNPDSSSGVVAIEGGISAFVDVVRAQRIGPTVFSYLNGSSGLGKTQLAFALQRSVLYLPLGEVLNI